MERSKRDGNDVQQGGGFVDCVQKNLFYTRRPSSVTGPGFSGFGVFEFFLRFLWGFDYI